MSGIKQWSKNVEVQANPGKRLRFIDASFSTPIAVGATKQIDFFAPTGYITRVRSFRFRYNDIPGAASGIKVISVHSNNLVYITTSEIAWNQINEYNAGFWQNTPSKVYPADLTAQSQIADRMIFDGVVPLSVSILNNTNVADVNTLKNIWFWVEDEKITS